MSYFKLKMKAVDSAVDPIKTSHTVTLTDASSQKTLNKVASTLVAEVIQRLEYYGDKSETELSEYADKLATAIAKAGT